MFLINIIIFHLIHIYILCYILFYWYICFYKCLNIKLYKWAHYFCTLYFAFLDCMLLLLMFVNLDPDDIWVSFVTMEEMLLSNVKMQPQFAPQKYQHMIIHCGTECVICECLYVLNYAHHPASLLCKGPALQHCGQELSLIKSKHRLSARCFSVVRGLRGKLEDW